MATISTRSEYDHVASIYLPIGLAVFGIVTVALLVLLVRYRARPDDGREPSERHENMPLELGYAVVLVLVAAFLVTVTFRAEGREEGLTPTAEASARALHVQVIAAQWTWRFVYPGTPAIQQVAPPFGATKLYVPAGQPVLFEGHSQDVVHDFWIPDLRFQRQVWPDHIERWALVFPTPGRYQGLCALFCGLYHDRMHFTAIALPPARFEAWLRARRAGTSGAASSSGSPTGAPSGVSG